MIDTPKIDKDALLEKYAANLANSKNKALYLRCARGFLEYTNNIDRVSIDRYLNALRKKGRRPGTINFVFRVIKRLFTVNGLAWEYHHGEAPAIGQRDEYRPQLSTDVIQVMISAAKGGKLHKDESCFLALSTTYGLRRAEMADLKPEDVDLANSAIYVSTVKSGRQRYHLIPPEIYSYLAEHDFSRAYSFVSVSQLFWQIVNNSGLGGLKSQRLGWHSIRRAVLNGLIDGGVNPFAARAFLRWKSASGELAMPTRYYGNVVVGLEGTTPMLEEAKGDEEVFKSHPFLPMWNEKGEA